MLKKFGEEKLNLQLRQHVAAAVAAFIEGRPEPDSSGAEALLDRFFDQLSARGLEDFESFRVRLLPRKWSSNGCRGAALLLSLYEPELRFEKAVLFRARCSINNAPTEEGNVFETAGIKEEAAELLELSQSACFANFAPQGIYIISASSVLGDTASDACLLKNFYYLNIADFVGNLFFKCFVGDSRPGFVGGLKMGRGCRNLLEFRITALPQVSQRPLF
ncbi:MAG: hypothetical protein HYX74_02945 [Acidobacteria bacterium]|nr:hypothetical protein [Acidobacteriota bacterium]